MGPGGPLVADVPAVAHAQDLSPIRDSVAWNFNDGQLPDIVS